MIPANKHLCQCFAPLLVRTQLVCTTFLGGGETSSQQACVVETHGHAKNCTLRGSFAIRGIFASRCVELRNPHARARDGAAQACSQSVSALHHLPQTRCNTGGRRKCGARATSHQQPKTPSSPQRSSASANSSLQRSNASPACLCRARDMPSTRFAPARTRAWSSRHLRLQGGAILQRNCNVNLLFPSMLPNVATANCTTNFTTMPLPSTHVRRMGELM